MNVVVVVVVLVVVGDKNSASSTDVVSTPGGGEFGDEIQRLKALHEKFQKMKHPTVTKSHVGHGNSADLPQPSLPEEESSKPSEVLPDVVEVEVVHEEAMETTDDDEQAVVRYE